MFAAKDFSYEGWLPPDENASRIVTGMQADAIYSVGPFDLPPGTSTTCVVAIVAGDSVHVQPDDFANLWDSSYPDNYYRSLDFSRLARNAVFSSWVFDTPGVDTDSGGFAGNYVICNNDTMWRSGDGVPDMRAGLPPPPPMVRIYPHDARLVIRWNGYASEQAVDLYTKEKDFEGYRVYAGRDERRTSLSLLASYDREDYNMYRFVLFKNGQGRWVNIDQPFTLDSLRQRFADSNLAPLLYTRAHPLQSGGSYFAFDTQDYNQSVLADQRGIHKAYPEYTAPPPSDTSLWSDSIVTTEHGRRLPKYYEYEYIVDDLLASVPYFVSVTAFDFGFARGGMPSEESSISATMIREYAEISADSVEATGLNVYVYPNPYRADADYAERGFENRDNSLSPDHAHLIHFANLPRVCKISIVSLDGDLIREIQHDFPQGGPESQHETWDLISKNRQLAASGMYYWAVESDSRTQIGKLVIIR